MSIMCCTTGVWTFNANGFKQLMQMTVGIHTPHRRWHKYFIHTVWSYRFPTLVDAECEHELSVCTWQPPPRTRPNHPPPPPQHYSQPSPSPIPPPWNDDVTDGREGRKEGRRRGGEGERHTNAEVKAGGAYWWDLGSYLSPVSLSGWLSSLSPDLILFTTPAPHTYTYTQPACRPAFRLYLYYIYTRTHAHPIALAVTHVRLNCWEQS